MPKPHTHKVQVREVTLPGVGIKYVMPLRAGGHVAVILKPDGTRHVYHFLEAQDRPFDVVKYDEDEAQQIANLLGSLVVHAPELGDLELALGDTEIEWINLDRNSPLIGKTLREVPLRTQTGASVVAIMRGDKSLPNPDVDTVFREGDTVLVIGSHKQCNDARDALSD